MIQYSLADYIVFNKWHSIKINQSINDEHVERKR
jgi:hypothetical protein